MSAIFQYDGIGRRRAKTVNGSTTGLVYDQLDSVQELVGGMPSANLAAMLGAATNAKRSPETGDLSLQVVESGCGGGI